MPAIDNFTLRALLDKEPINRGQVESTCVDNLDYDYETQTLTVSHPGTGGDGGPGTWEYFDVPLQVYVEFAQAFSLGTYFNLYIKGQYSYRKVG